MNPGSNTSAAGYPGARHLRHAGLVVRDLEKSLWFYRDCLGLVVQVDQREQGPFLDHLLGAEGVRVRTVKLAFPEGPGMIELLQFEAPRPASVFKPDLFTPGPTHLALTVGDLDALHSTLTPRGVRFLADPRVAVDGRAKVAFCYDPDDVPLELVELLNP